MLDLQNGNSRHLVNRKGRLVGFQLHFHCLVAPPRRWKRKSLDATVRIDLLQKTVAILLVIKMSGEKRSAGMRKEIFVAIVVEILLKIPLLCVTLCHCDCLALLFSSIVAAILFVSDNWWNSVCLHWWFNNLIVILGWNNFWRFIYLFRNDVEMLRKC